MQPGAKELMTAGRPLRAQEKQSVMHRKHQRTRDAGSHSVPVGKPLQGMSALGVGKPELPGSGT